ncbi:hypothetical protein BHE74_00033129 [Ensete ventricosum]|nr:hypothetical protein GW17_00010625 [Ensete ventricosum]RWW59907.1 hypothetical protein BHE74_00033129 [Ensete ventricosum]RZS27344.1 hypothetical protein BHM03_00060815 [Ensete ventricosum]
MAVATFRPSMVTKPFAGRRSRRDLVPGMGITRTGDLPGAVALRSRPRPGFAEIHASGAEDRSGETAPPLSPLPHPTRHDP